MLREKITEELLVVSLPTSAALRLMQPISMPSVVMGVRRVLLWGADSPADCKDYQSALARSKPGRKED